VLVIKNTYWHLCAPVVNIFDPLMIQLSPSRTARVLQVRDVRATFRFGVAQTQPYPRR